MELARVEKEELEGKMRSLESELEDFLLEDDRDASRDIIMEIRPYRGIEAGLFAADLFRMYSKYAMKKGWKIEPISSSITEKGGFKEVIFSVSGDNVYKMMKFESGTHRCSACLRPRRPQDTYVCGYGGGPARSGRHRSRYKDRRPQD